VLVIVSIAVVVDVGRIVDIEVVSLRAIEEYTISVETDNGPALAVILLVGPRRSTAGWNVSHFQRRDTWETY
jgi:hypothetical protein